MGFEIVRAASFGRPRETGSIKLAPMGGKSVLFRIAPDLADVAGIVLGGKISLLIGHGVDAGKLKILPVSEIAGSSVRVRRWGTSKDLVFSIRCEAVGLAQIKHTVAVHHEVVDGNLVALLPTDMLLTAKAPADAA